MNKSAKQPWFSFLRTELGFYRSLTLFVFAVVLAIRPIYSQTHEDPLWERLVIAGLCLGMFLVSFFSKWVRENMEKLIFYGGYFPVLFWLFHLAYLNKLGEGDVVSLLTAIFGMSIDISDRKRLLLFSGFLLVVGGAVSFTVENPDLDGTLFFIILLIVAVLTNLILGYRMDIQARLKSREVLLRSIFRESPDALFLVKPEEKGILKVIDCNDKAHQFFGTESLDDIQALNLPGVCLRALEEEEATRILQLNQDFEEISVKKEIRFTRKNGKIFWGDLAIKPFETGEEQQMLFRISDITQKKNAESSMRLAESILTRVDNLVMVADDHGRITYISPSVEKILGYSPMELLNEGWWEVTQANEDTNTKEKEYIQQAALGKLPVRTDPYECRYVARDGSEKWILWKDTYVAEDQLVIGVGYDHTEHRKESELRESIFRIADAANRFDTLQDLFWFIDREIRKVIKTRNLYIALFDRDKNLLSFPHYADEQFPEGMPANRLTRNFSNGLTEYLIRTQRPALLDDSDIQRLASLGEIDYSGKTPAQWLGAPLLDKNQAYGAIAIQDYDNNKAFDENDLELLKFISGQIESVILRKHAEEALRESEERYRIISEATFEGIAIHRGGFIVEANQAFADMFGYSREEINGMNIIDFVVDTFRDNVRETIAKAEERPYEFEGIRKDGTTFFVESVGKNHIYNGLPSRISAIRDITGRKKAEEAEKIAETEATFRALVQHGSDVITIMDQDGYISFESPNIDKILGIPRGKMMGQSFVEFVHAEDRESILEIIEKSKANPHELIFAEYRIHHPDGNERYFQSIFNNLSDDRLVKGILVNSREITEKIENEKRLRKTADRFRFLAENTGELIARLDGEGNYTYVSPSSERIMGLDPTELLGKSPLEAVHPDDREITRECMEDLLQNGGQCTLEYRCVTSRDEVIWLETISRAIRDSENTRTEEIITASRDITERKKNEFILRESEQRYRSLVETMNEGILITDVNDVILHVNTRFCEMTGYEYEELVGKKGYENLIPDPEQRILVESKTSLRAQGVRDSYEVELATKTGEPLWVLISGSPYLDGGNRFQGAIGVIADITEIKLNQKQLVENEERYRSLVENAPEAIVVLDTTTGNFTEVNSNTVELFGLSATELMEKGPIHLSPEFQPDGRKSVEIAKEVIGSALKGNQEVFEWIHLNAKGEEIPCEVRLSAIPGSPNMVRGTITDISERKRVEIALKESEEKFRMLYSTANDGIFIMDGDKFVDCNDMVLELFECSRPEIIGHTPWEFSPEFQPDGLPSPESARTKIEGAYSGKPQRFIWKHKSKKGKLFDAEISLNIFTLKDKNYLQALVRDMTEQIEAERALRLSEEKNKAILDAIPDLMFRVSKSGEILDYKANNLAGTMVGNGPLVGRNVKELLPLEVNARVMLGIQNCLASDEIEIFEYQVQTSKGSRDFETRMVKSNPHEAVAIVRDITESKKSQLALEASEAKKEAILNAIPDLMFMVSRDGYILDFKFNSNEELLAAPEEILNHHMSDYLPPEHVETWMKHINKTLETQDLVIYEYQMKVDAGMQDFESRLVPCGEDLVLTMVRNVTERKKAENELIKSNFELDSFVYRASHDLKAPLSSLLGLISLVESNDIDQETREYVGMMKKSIQKLESFIVDLTDYSRNTRLEVAQIEINFRELIDETLQNLHFMENAEKVKVNVTISDQVPFHSDEVRIRIIFNNLLSNAIKYMNPNKKVPWLNVDVVSTKEKATIIISDNGMGIPEKHHDDIFKMFFRASVQSHGSGLGLYIVHNAIEKLDGEIYLQSAEGEGTTFTVEIPNKPKKAKKKGLKEIEEKTS